MIARLALALVLLGAVINHSAANYSCARVVGHLKCNGESHVKGTITLYDDDNDPEGYDPKMYKEFGFGDYREPNPKRIESGSGFRSSGCQFDAASDVDPLIRVSGYNCNGKTNTFWVYLNRDKCHVSYPTRSYDKTPDLTLQIGFYACTNVHIDLGTEKFTQG